MYGWIVIRRKWLSLSCMQIIDIRHFFDRCITKFRPNQFSSGLVEMHKLPLRIINGNSIRYCFDNGIEACAFNLQGLCHYLCFMPCATYLAGNDYDSEADKEERDALGNIVSVVQVPEDCWSRNRDIEKDETGERCYNAWSCSPG